MDEKSATENSAPLEEGVWQGFLQEGAHNSSNSEGHLVMLGNANSGKTAIVSQMGRLESNKGEMKAFLMMRYSYIHITAPDSEEITSLLNIWQISEASHSVLLDVVVKPSQMKNITYMICIDLSEPSTIEQQFEKWIKVAHETQERLLSRLSEQEQYDLKRQISEHIQYYVNPNDAEAQVPSDEEKADIPLQENTPEINLGCPMIVVGAKADLFRQKFQSDADANDRYDLVMAYLRSWSLKYGGSVFNMALGMKEQAGRMLRYVDHRLFGTFFDRAPNVLVVLSNLISKNNARKEESFLFVPSGYDTEGIIQQSASGRELNNFEELFPSRQAEEKKHRKIQLKADADQTFYNTLNFDLNHAQNQSTTASRPARPAANGTSRFTDATNARPAPNAAATGNGNEAVHTFFRELLKSGNSPGDNTATRMALSTMQNDG